MMADLIETDLKLIPGLFVKSTKLPEGRVIPQHAHGYSHISVVAAGSVRVWDGETVLGDYRAPAGITIAARRQHAFLALEPDTVVLCIHRVGPDGEPEIIEEG